MYRYVQRALHKYVEIVAGEALFRVLADEAANQIPRLFGAGAEGVELRVGVDGEPGARNELVELGRVRDRVHRVVDVAADKEGRCLNSPGDLPKVIEVVEVRPLVQRQIELVHRLPVGSMVRLHGAL